MEGRLDIRRLRQQVSAVLASLLVLGGALAWRGAAWAREPPVVFLTSNNSLATLERSMAEHYLALSARGQLPVQRVRDDIGLPPRQLMYALGLIRGDPQDENFPIELDRMLCGMNADLCSTRPDGTPHWRNGKHDGICVPAVHWSDAVRTTRASTSSSVAALEAKLGSCAAFGGDCSRVHQALQHVEVGAKDALVPVLAQAAHDSTGMPTRCGSSADVRATGSIDAAGRSYLLHAAGIELQAPFEEASTGPAGEAVPSPVRARLATGERLEIDYAASATPRSAHDRVVAMAPADTILTETSGTMTSSRHRVTSSRVWPAAAVAAASSESAANGEPQENTESDESDPAEPPVVSANPDPAPADLPAGASVESTTSSNATAAAVAANGVALDPTALSQAGIEPPEQAGKPVSVFVFDTEANTSHALLAHDRSVGECLGEPSFQLAPEPDPFTDHGTHISALIGGCELGVNPFAAIRGVQLVKESGQPFDYEMVGTINDAIIGRRVHERIANFSYNLAQPDVEVRNRLSEIVSDAREILFVAAAGNEPVSLDDGCETLPACLALGKHENLIVVGGVAMEQGRLVLWQDSARSARHVDLLAPAHEVMSAVWNMPRVGRMSGTSQGAAIVSGVASLVFAAAKDGFPRDPSQVKHRLMATARVNPSLQPHSRSGAVDAAMALATRQTLVYEETEGGVEKTAQGEYLGLVDQHDARSRPTVAFTLHGRDESLSMCNIYRIARYAADRYFVVHERGGRQQGDWWDQAEFVHEARLQTISKSMRFRDALTGRELRVPLPRVISFYDAFSPDRPCDPNSRTVAHEEDDY